MSTLKIPLINNEVEQYEEPIAPRTDSLAAAGFYIQPSSGALDTLVGVERGANGHLFLKDVDTYLDLYALGIVLTVTCASTVAIGDFITYPIGGTVTTASALDPALLTSIGVVVSKVSATVAVVQTGGVCSVFSGLTPGQAYYVGTTGRPSALPPTAANGTKLYAQKVGRALNSSTLLLNISPEIIGYYSS